MPSDQPNTGTAPDQSATPYRVLARKYRPSTVDELIGQESLVQTLSNALAMGRLAHAFILTGLRGIGKTTTARIIAKGLNCIGADGNGQPTLTPCGVCTHCTDIASSRHVDVMEMDAASNTGVDDVRDIIDGVHYAPLSARYKIYIIDEVHMLSRNAFNALLKTLEEPPESVKFVFATTEIRKVPVTVLSRCQRFDLRRVETDRMADHLKMIADKEAIHIEDAALKRLARAAEGSVRDALSLLDQAAALTSNQIEDNAVAAMLGQAGRMDAIQIVKAALMGQADQAMAGLDNAIKSGAEAIMIIADMLDYIHMASRIAAGGSITDLPESEQAELDHMAKDITLSRLARAWQIMLKGHGEVNLAPDPHAAADMVLIRLAHVANMPTPGDLVKKLKDVTPDMLASSTPASSAPTSSAPVSSTSVSSTLTKKWPDQDMPPPMADTPDHMPDHMVPAPSAPSSPQLASPQLASPQPVPENMIQMAQIFEDHGELKLASYLRTRIRPVLLEAGRFEFSADRPLDESVPGQIGYFLTEWTGMRWMVSVATQSGSDTLDEIEHAQKQAIRDSLAADPIVKSAMDTFPDSTIHSITPLTGMVTLTDDPADLSDAESSDDDEKKADHA
ncbi:DNA polymerase III subunit gamma/tau [Alphaproteobacteria bacterium]|nr:DNA polymerase III subunit gamma/tau [Alphaproteobacteria bacterium]